MLGFSLGKLLVLAAIVAAVWFGFKWLGRVKQIRKESGKTAVGGAAPGVQDTVQCRQCGLFVVAKGAKNCGRADCPYSG